MIHTRSLGATVLTEGSIKVCCRFCGIRYKDITYDLFMSIYRNNRERSVYKEMNKILRHYTVRWEEQLREHYEKEHFFELSILRTNGDIF